MKKLLGILLTFFALNAHAQFSGAQGDKFYKTLESVQYKSGRKVEDMTKGQMATTTWAEKRMAYYNDLYRKYIMTNTKKALYYLDSSRYFYRIRKVHNQTIKDSTEKINKLNGIK